MTEQTKAETRGWLAEKFGLNEQSSAKEIRAAFMKNLKDEGFLPPPSLSEAYVASRSDEPSGRDLSEHAFFEMEDRLRNDIEQFAFDFFTYPLAERFGHWQSLIERARWNPSLTSRLNQLRRGISAEMPSQAVEDPFVRTVAEAICTTFTLPPTAKAIQRQMVVRRASHNTKDWQRAARVIKKTFRGIASLEPELLEELIRGKGPPKVTPVAQTASTSSKSGSDQGTRAIQWIAIVGVIAVVSLIRLASTNSTRSTNREVRDYEINIKDLQNWRNPPGFPHFEERRDLQKNPLEEQKRREFQRFLDHAEKRHNKFLPPMDEKKDKGTGMNEGPSDVP